MSFKIGFGGQGNRFRLVPLSWGDLVVKEFGLTLDGCYQPSNVTIEESNGSVVIKMAGGGDDRDAAMINGWWVVPTEDLNTSAKAGYLVEVEIGTRQDGLLWRLAASSGASVTWGGGMHFGGASRRPVAIRDGRELFELTVRVIDQILQCVWA